MRSTLSTSVLSVLAACIFTVVGAANFVDFWPLGEPGAGTSKSLVIEFPDFKCADGNVMIAVYSEDNGFLSDEAFIRRIVKCTELSENKVELQLPSGRFAVAVYHDFNGNKKLDRNFISYPTEPFGFSNNPKCYTGPPNFDQAAFNLTSDMEIRIVLK